MTATVFGVDANQFVGVAGCALAAVACGRRAWAGRPPWRSPWVWLTAAQGLFALEMMSDLRYRAHRLVDAVLRSHDWYATRLSLQLTLLLLLLLLLSAAAASLWRLQRRDAAAAMAAAGSVLMAGLLLVEIVSLHAVDAIMYTPLGPINIVAWAWAVASATVILSAQAGRRRRAA